MNRSENMTKTVGEFFLIWFIPFCKLADGIISILTFGIFYTSFTLWSCKQLARYRMKRI
jgi:hypothetical protein